MTTGNLVEYGDCRAILDRWFDADVEVQTCVTSPPYWGLRDYGVPGQFGLERTPEEYVAVMVNVFRYVWDILAEDGTLWLNMGDSYHNGDKGGYAKDRVKAEDSLQKSNLGANFIGAPNRQPHPLLKPKDLVGVPWMLAFALRADGWYLRQDIIWSKPNPMPESVRDRCTKAHEYIFMLSKSERYYYDADAIKEPARWDKWGTQRFTKERQGAANLVKERSLAEIKELGKGERNKRSVWHVATKPFKGAHFATFPPDLITPCILAGSRPNDIVLDPFMGSGTTAQVALQHGRRYLGCELNPAYAPLIDERIAKVSPVTAAAAAD